MKPVTALCLASLVACAYRVPNLPSIPARAPIAARIYVVAHEPRAEQSQADFGWELASITARKLELAGFEPVVVGDFTAVAAGAPLVDRIELKSLCRTEWAPWLVLSLGIIPDWGCDVYGWMFDLRRAPGEPAQTIDTYFTIDRMRGWPALLMNLRDDYVAEPAAEWTQDYEVRALRAAVQDALAKPPGKP